MLILHVLDHSIPLHSGYTFRSRSIFEHQRRLGWQTDHITSTKHADAVETQPDEEVVEGLHFFRTPPRSALLHALPVVNQYAVIRDLERRLTEVARQIRPDVLHAHSPALNGIAAVRVGRRLGIPVGYEVRGFWEDAAVSHGTAKDGDLRYRITRGLETRALRRADHCFCICEGLRNDIAARGIAADKITVIPNAVDIENFQPVERVDTALQQALALQDKQVIGFIGSFYYYEGLDLLLQAASLLRQRQPDLHVLLVGGGPAEGQLKALADELGMAGVPAARVESACASGGAAFRAAYLEVASGASDFVLAGGVEKMNDGADATYCLATAADQEYEAYNGVTFPGLYAMMAVAHMAKYKTTREQLASVAVKNHRNGSKNPRAQFPMEITLEGVINSVKVADPLNILDCSPITDGAAAVILTTEEIAKKRQEEKKNVA